MKDWGWSGEEGGRGNPVVTTEPKSPPSRFTPPRILVSYIIVCATVAPPKEWPNARTDVVGGMERVLSVNVRSAALISIAWFTELGSERFMFPPTARVPSGNSTVVS